MSVSRYARIKLLRGSFVRITNVYIPAALDGTVDINGSLADAFKNINLRQRELGQEPFEMFVLDGTFEKELV